MRIERLVRGDEPLLAAAAATSSTAFRTGPDGAVSLDEGHHLLLARGRCFNGGVHSFALFAGLALIVTLTPGPATALVMRSALRGGRRAAFLTTLGIVGVLAWGAASAAGIAALVAASQVAFLVLKVAGAAVLIVLGLQSLRAGAAKPERGVSGRPFRDGVVTALANPKLAVFFVALFPQFLKAGGRSTLATGLLMASFIVALDLVWYSILERS